MVKKDFLISYTKPDKEWAEWIAWQLDEAGYTTVIESWDFRPGHLQIFELDKAIKQTKKTIVVLSQNYLDLLYVHPEWADALKKNKLIPIKVKECEPLGLLGLVIAIDLTRLPEEVAKRELASKIQTDKRQKPQSQPKFSSLVAKGKYPGLQPRIWNLTYRRNPNFTGREDVLTKLRQKLTKKRAAIITQAISGLGGVGKTQTAVEYIYRYAVEASKYNIVWWIRSDGPTLASDYTALARELNLAERDEQDQSIVIEAIKKWLSINKGWLLIFDNVEDPLRLERFLPQGGQGHILMTSRNPIWKGMGDVLELDVFKRDESEEFLFKRTGLDDKKGATELAEELGDFPLALEQAGAFIEIHGIGYQKYLELYRNRRKTLWTLEKKPKGYPYTIATTWSLSMEMVGKESLASVWILNLFAFFASDDIPQTLLSDGIEYLPKNLSNVVVDELKRIAAVGILRRYSLVELGIESISIHRLVQAIVRDNLSAKSRRKWIGIGINLVNKSFEFKEDKIETWEKAQRLLSHVLNLTNYAEHSKIELDKLGNLLNGVGSYFLARAEYEEAQKTLDRALKINETIYGSDHFYVAEVLNSLSLLLKELKQLEGAKELSQKALKIAEKTYHQDDPSISIYLNTFGRILVDLGQLQEAKQILEKALTTDEKSFEEDHPFILRSANSLGTLLLMLGEFADARKAFERALKIAEKIYGPTHPYTGTIVNNLGYALQEIGESEQAKKAYERALSIGESFYGLDHPYIATLIGNLADLSYNLGNYDTAREDNEKALSIVKKARGEDHPEVARYLSNLGVVLKAQGKLTEARTAYEQALSIDKKAYGEEHPELANKYSNLGALLYELSEFKEARTAYEQALSIDKKVYGEEHPEVAIDLSGLGNVLRELGELDAARRSLEQALAIGEKFYGLEHRNVAIFTTNLGNVFVKLGNIEEAKKAYQNALDIFEKLLGKDHARTKLVQQKLDSLASGLSD